MGGIIDIDVRQVRNSLKMSQARFCASFGFNLGTFRHWEQGSRRPDAAASVLLAVIAHRPEIVIEVVSNVGRPSTAAA